MNGYAFAFSAFTPVQYIPASGKVFYATTATVSIDMTAAKTDKSAMLSNNYLVRERVIAMAQNPEMIDSYSINDKSLNGYELLVITPEEYVEDFDSYIDLYTYKGLRTRVVSVESIYDTTEGIDNQDKIRNFIINEYQNNDIMMVLLGGDVALIPYRGFIVMYYPEAVIRLTTIFPLTFIMLPWTVHGTTMAMASGERLEKTTCYRK